MPATAMVITNGHLGDGYGKTAHGLIRGSERYTVRAVLDPAHAGADAGMLLDQVHRGIPVCATLDELIQKNGGPPEYAVIGVAFEGGILPPGWKPILLEVLARGISLVAGLHVPLAADPELAAAARKSGARIIDIRKPKPFEDLHFFSGDIYRVKIPRVAVLGTDCAVGKRTTCRMTLEMCRADGIAAEMIYTGQTGWLQGYPYGFILDATPNDFVSGELERAIVQCAAERRPDLILIEGQSALQNPFGPCGAEIILSGNVRHVILQHVPFRTHYEELERYECRIPSVPQEIALLRAYGAETIAVGLNGEGGSPEALKTFQEQLAAELDIPVIRPLEEGLGKLRPRIRRLLG
ncbi:MAG: DUF1611 domain-containing protein [Desulfobacterales bacterium]|nr:DUF1611 domain-containing protein [Desulfobacterales bacterium]